ncbi:MAG: hypothetical protein SGI83_11945 [Bacteroidota bacterium]|nr:hypothetical protein [Bacteroidota bacterium]
MKISALLLLPFFMITATTSFGQEKNKEVMIKKIFTALAEKDEDGFVDLFPDVKTIKGFMLKSLAKNGGGKDEQEVKSFLESLDDSSMQIEFREDFQKYIRMGETHGVDWSMARFHSYTTDSVQVTEDGITTPMLKGKIYFILDTAKFFINYDEVIWFDPHGWYGVNINLIDRKSRENEAEGFDWDSQVVDSTLMIMDSAVAATMSDTGMTVIAEVIPPGKNKMNKEKEKNKPIKTKTKAHARKPEL